MAARKPRTPDSDAAPARKPPPPVLPILRARGQAEAADDTQPQPPPRRVALSGWQKLKLRPAATRIVSVGLVLAGLSGAVGSVPWADHSDVRGHCTD